VRAMVALGALLAALTVLPAGAGAASRPPSEFFGTQTWSFPSEPEFDRMRSGRVGMLRTTFTWAMVEPRPGDRNWVAYDFLVSRAARRGIDVLPVLIGSPPYVARRETYPPRRRADIRRFQAFVADAVRRYGPRGRFWAENPGVPHRPINHWQVWNEPSFPSYWYGRPSARGYARFLRPVRRTIKRANRRAKVVLAGLPESRSGVPMLRYLSQLYGGGARRAFDVVALHPYARDHRGVEGALVRVRRLMRRRGDRRKPIWLTELGWASAGPRGPFVAGVAGQASRLERTYRMLIRKRRRYGVQRTVWFSFRDRPLSAGERDWWAPHTGLFDTAGNPKPAWRSLTRLSGGSAGSGPIP
jgi:polysaccharide biosynthesis protein PslG